MEILFTLPSAYTRYIRKNPKDFPGITGSYSDPEGKKLGSGGGTVHVLWEAFQSAKQADPGLTLSGWIASEKRMIIHSDGQSRRLPAYAPEGKSRLPFPVFKWGRGLNLRQTLSDIQMPFLKKILEKAPQGMNTLIVSGDALVYSESPVPDIPVADVVCVGVWTQPEIAARHGVFICPVNQPENLEFMVQKPGIEELQQLNQDYLYLLDAGIWLLSDQAVDILFRQCGYKPDHQKFSDDTPDYYDLYTDFGSHLGNHPKNQNTTISSKILIPAAAEFYHFGSNTDLLKSTTALHNRVSDQREIWHKKVKPSPDIFIQNAVTHQHFRESNQHIWIENSYIPESWKLNDHHIITGIPENNWNLELPPGICLDFVHIGKTAWCIRYYGFQDTFRGNVKNPLTQWMQASFADWFSSRSFDISGFFSNPETDIYEAAIFPVLEAEDLDENFIQWLIRDSRQDKKQAEKNRIKYLKAKRISCAQILQQVQHDRLRASRQKNILASYQALAVNARQSIFYQLDLKQAMNDFIRYKLPLPGELPPGTPMMTKIHDAMMRSYYLEMARQPGSAQYEERAFQLLQEGMMTDAGNTAQEPVLNLQPDQILWGRSPVRLDLAGGWTDTPPYCILFGGKVVNIAVELNGQPPLQVFIRPRTTPEIVIHSIDLSVTETVKEYKDLDHVSKVGSAFSIPRAALMLSGFYPGFGQGRYKSLKQQLQAFGGGFDISLMVAVPKGSGLGTSSILASTLLGALSEFCKLGWDKHMLANRTLILEQMLTTGGGWQDQYGGLFEGIKIIESTPGFRQNPSVQWAPDHLFTLRDSKETILLYYTGINRVAKNILHEIVRGMFLNSGAHLAILSDMKQLAGYTYDCIRNHNHDGLVQAVGESWRLNQALDPGTNTPAIMDILAKISDYTLSTKLLGAGGGGYLMIFAKDLTAAGRIRNILTNNRPNPGARFVDWEVSATGFQLSRS